MKKKKRRRRDIGHKMVGGLRGRRVGGIGSGADDVDKINIGHWFRLGEVCGRQQREWRRGGEVESGKAEDKTDESVFKH